MSISTSRAATIAALVTALCFLIAGAVGQDGDGWLGDALPQWLGNIAWIGLLLGGLITVSLGIAMLIQRLVGRRSAGGGPAAQ